MKESPSKNPLPVKWVATSAIFGLLLLGAAFFIVIQSATRKELETLIATLEKKSEFLDSQLRQTTSQLRQTTELTSALSSAIDPSKLGQITESLKKPTDEKSYQGRRSNLLKDFVQVTDAFTRPRVYHHSAFVNPEENCIEKRGSTLCKYMDSRYKDYYFCKKCDLLRVAVNSTGELANEYSFKSLMIIQNEQDDPVVFDSVKTLKARLAEEFPIISELKCRMITLRGHESDFILTKEEYQALLKTFELANMPEIKK